MKRVIRSALIQMSCSTDKDANVAKSVSMIEEAARQKAQIVCLQELFSSTYFPQQMDHIFFQLAEPIPGPITKTMTELAKRLHIILIVPMFEKTLGRVYYNTAVLINEDGHVLGTYRKSHIPEFVGYIEKFYFKPGNTGYHVFKTSFAHVGISICYDQWFPEVARILTLRGAEVIFQPTAIGSDPAYPTYPLKDKWELVIRSQAFENNVFIGVVNRVGVEGAMKFYGGSFFCSPGGDIIAHAQTENDEIIISDLDLDQIVEEHKHFQKLRDRRPETYGDLVKPLP